MKLRKFIALIQHSPLQQCKTQRALWLYVTELVKRFTGGSDNNSNSSDDNTEGSKSCLVTDVQASVAA